MSNEKADLSRRDFIKQSTVFTAMSAAYYSTAMKTDAMAQARAQLPVRLVGNDEIVPYEYSVPPP